MLGGSKASGPAYRRLVSVASVRYGGLSKVTEEHLLPYLLLDMASRLLCSQCLPVYFHVTVMERIQETLPMFPHPHPYCLLGF